MIHRLSISFTARPLAETEARQDARDWGKSKKIMITAVGVLSVSQPVSLSVILPGHTQSMQPWRYGIENGSFFFSSNSH